MIKEMDFKIKKEEWMKNGICTYPEIDPDIWFPKAFLKTNPETEMAIRLCHQCPVRKNCIEYAMQNWPLEGIWGGLKEKQLKELYVQRQKEKKNERTNNA